MFEYIEIDGKKYPFIINIYVLGEMQRETGIPWYELDVRKDIYLFEPLLWYALEVGHFVAKETFEIKRDDVKRMLMDDKVYVQAMDIMTKLSPPASEATDDQLDKKK